MKYTEARYLPEKYDSNTSTIVCKDTVLILIFGKPVLVITIKSQDIADSYEKYFRILWRSARKTA